MLLWHGSPYTFDKFDINQFDDTGWVGGGIYLTENKEVAKLYKGGTNVKGQKPINPSLTAYKIKDGLNILDADKVINKEFFVLVEKYIYEDKRIRYQFRNRTIDYWEGINSPSIGLKERLINMMKNNCTIAEAIDAIQRIKPDGTTWDLARKIISKQYDGIAAVSYHKDEKIPNRQYVIYNPNNLVEIKREF